MKAAIPLNRNILLPLGFAAAASAEDEVIQKTYMNKEVE